jgi:hypothetical protein
VVGHLQEMFKDCHPIHYTQEREKQLHHDNLAA